MNYLVNCDYGAERKGDYDKRDEICKLFVPAKSQIEPNGCGNLAYQLQIDKELKCQFGQYQPFDASKCLLYQAIPAALLLYRTICTFGPVKLNCDGKEGYKVPWQYVLKHVPTKKLITLSEWKGASSFRCEFSSHEELPESLKNDLLKLFEYLLSDNCAHPYDGVTAGSVA